jgi:hypothetical protein
VVELPRLERGRIGKSVCAGEVARQLDGSVECPSVQVKDKRSVTSRLVERLWVARVLLRRLGAASLRNGLASVRAASWIRGVRNIGDSVAVMAAKLSVHGECFSNKLTSKHCRSWAFDYRTGSKVSDYTTIRLSIGGGGATSGTVSRRLFPLPRFGALSLQ